MEILITILLIVARVLDFLTTPIYKFKARNKRQNLPPLKNELLRLSATEIADRIRKKKLSSEEICQIYIDRIKEVNPIINAVVEDRFNDALKEAKQVDSYLQTTSLNIEELEKFKPLLGVPMTIKESCSVKGMSLCVGLKYRLGYKAENDSEVVARLRSCGAIVLLVSAAPEACLSWETFSYVNGSTNNPYDTTCTSGGSSGGEGALIGAGASLIGIGSDIAGSIRLPAAFNGIFGHKPTPRIIPIKGHWPVVGDPRYDEFLVMGPLARYAIDLRLLMKVLCGNKLSTVLKLDEPVNLEQLNIFFMEDVGFHVTIPNVSSEIKNAIMKSVQHLTYNCRATSSNYKFRDFKKVQVIGSSVIFSLKNIPNAMKSQNSSFWLEAMRTLIGRSNFTLNLLYFHLLEKIFKNIVSEYSAEVELLKTLVTEQLGTNGVIILPTFNEPAYKHHQLFFKNGFNYMVLANAIGLPATNVPCGLDKNGMPIGIQIIAAPHQDRLCLAVAEELERHFGGWIPPPEKK